MARTVERELADEAVKRALRSAFDVALDALVAMRTAEGARLEHELRTRMNRVAALADSLESRAGVVADAVRERLRKRAEQLRSETGFEDGARLAAEIVIAADRLDVTEEIVRLRSHVVQFGEMIDESGPGKPAGRRPRLLMQGARSRGEHDRLEGQRRAGGATSSSVSKTELERVREQVQNIE